MLPFIKKFLENYTSPIYCAAEVSCQDGAAPKHRFIEEPTLSQGYFWGIMFCGGAYAGALRIKE